MKKKLPVVALCFIAVLSVPIFFNLDKEALKQEVRKLPRAERKKARSEYFLNKLKDPKTNKIPDNVRARETAFATNLASNSRIRPLADGSGTHEWAELGPSDVGGRTRALALDVRNSDIVMAAGVSGGIWKSTDGGNTWAPKLPNGSNLSISFLAQDPVNNDVWYATTGEVSDGGSASGKGQGNSFNGSGIYKSLDNGDSWSLMTYEFDNSTSSFVKQTTTNTDIASNPFVSPFRVTSKITVHDIQGVNTVFVCSYFYGIWVSIDGGSSFKRFVGSLSNNEDPRYSDVIVDSNDNITIWFGPTSTTNGFFRSLDGGNTFTNLTPPDYSIAGQNARCILALAPSQQSTVYAFLYDNPGTGEQNHFYIFDYSGFDSGGSATFANRSSNLPTFPRSIFDGETEFTTQGGYDMTLVVHPTNPDFVVLGYVELIKSEDGFATDISGDAAKFWIGGNENPDRQVEQLDFGKTHHADQHILFFDPNNPNALWSGHDGGISKTADVTANRVIWESKNNDYNVTQYYTVAIARDKTETGVIGGTQDNGTPELDASQFVNDLIPSSFDLSSGDGAFCYYGNDVTYASAQYGSITINGINIFSFGFIEPPFDLEKLFIHPFAVDPNDEGTMFYSSFGNGILARNVNFDEAVAQENQSLIDEGWEDININNAVAMSAIKVSDQNPSHKLYFGGLLNNNPVLFSWDDANTNTDEGTMEAFNLVANVTAGSWLNDIAINPTDGNEIVLVYSNYNITGLFHSLDGGVTLTAIEGNLSLNDDQGASGFTGPSMRAAEIVVDWQGKEKYYVATSVGLYYTETLAGDNTEWTLETSLLNNVVIEDLDSRPSDNTIVAGTHGRGIFIGQKFNLTPVAEDQSFELDENSSKDAAVGSVVFAEPEGDDVVITILDGNANEAFAVNNIGAIVVNNSDALDFETTPEFTLVISISDGELSTTTSLTISLKDINEAPSIEDQTFSIDENSNENTSIGSIVAIDEDQDDLVFSITSGNTNNAFSVNSSTGELLVNTSAELDFETTPTFTLTIKVDDGELNDEATTTVDLNDINEAPVIENQSFNIDENSSNATSIGMVQATDQENDDLTFSITSGNTNDVFEINSSTGEITVKTQALLNFEWTVDYPLVIEVGDGEFTKNATVTITVNDLNETPEISNQVFNYDENASSLNLGVVEASDPDGNNLTFSIKSGNTDDAFKIDLNTGDLQVSEISSVDFEIQNSYSLVVEVADSELKAEAIMTVTINDVNEAPKISDQTFETDEGLDNGSVVATVVATDPENDDITYSLKSGNIDDAFSINENTGAITISDMNVLEFDVNPTFSLVVEISDAEFTAEATITISLIEVILSIEEDFLNSIKVYPNPAQNQLNVNLSMLQQQELTIELTNMLGQGHLLFKGLHIGEFQRNFDLSNFSKGYYILNFKYSDKQISKKLIIR